MGDRSSRAESHLRRGLALWLMLVACGGSADGGDESADSGESAGTAGPEPSWAQSFGEMGAVGNAVAIAGHGSIVLGGGFVVRADLGGAPLVYAEFNVDAALSVYNIELWRPQR